jgi:hypothetical protein
MRKVSFVFFGLAFVIALYTYGVPFLSRPQAPACPRPTPIPGKIHTRTNGLKNKKIQLEKRFVVFFQLIKPIKRE